MLAFSNFSPSHTLLWQKTQYYVITSNTSWAMFEERLHRSVRDNMPRLRHHITTIHFIPLPCF